jgi:glycosyltransferase involved in cell wall biosynthesis
VKNVLVITYWSFDDALIQTYTLPYVRIIAAHIPAGSTIHLITLEKDHSIVHDKRGSAIRAALPPGIVWAPLRYHRFGIRAVASWLLNIFRLTRYISKQKILVIHAWATPAGAVGYLLSRITGKPLVIDSYEPHAEAMVENGTWQRTSAAFRILFWLERKQSQHASWLISATEGMKGYARTRYGVTKAHFLVKPACVDLSLFSEKNVKNAELIASFGLHDKLVIGYAGKFGGIYLELEVFDLLKHAHDHWGDRLRILLLTSHSVAEIDGYCRKAGLNPNIVITRFVPHAQIADYIGLADIALTPVKPVPTKRFCTPIKDGEYWALGLLVVISHDISDDSDIILDNDAGVVIDKYETGEFIAAFEKIDRLLREPETQRRERIRSIAQRYRNFSVAHQVYSIVYGDGFK